MRTITDAFTPYIGTTEYHGIVAKIQQWYYGCLIKDSWCATSVSYFANEVGILDQIGGKNENVCLMMRAAEKTGKGAFYHKAELKKRRIRRGTILFMLWDGEMRPDNPSKHVTTAAEDFDYTGRGYCKCLGGNQGDQIKIAQYSQAKIYAAFEPDYGEGHKTLRRGDKGAAVVELQGILNRLGYKDGMGNFLAADGSYGPRTEAAVKNLQEDQGLEVDGICGPITWAKIDEWLAWAHTVTPSTPLNVRKGPGKDYDWITVIFDGQEYETTREKDGWDYLPKLDGWASAAYLIP